MSNEEFKPTITKEVLVSVMDQSLFLMAYKDIEKAFKGECYMGVFILASCFIDAMAGFHAGVTKQTCTRGNSRRFKEFVKKFMPLYDAEMLYEDLRNGLVHAYTSGKTYVFTHSNNAGFHFDKTQKGSIILNLEDFLAHIRSAYSQLRNEILNDHSAYIHAHIRFDEMGLMQGRPLKDL
ncbi:MAG: hypothetical protein HPY53_13515 [Brevinematales bacterium]|nr:hypothetical protein [Brevinematales bacterium]